MNYFIKKRLKYIICVFIIVKLLILFGAFTHLFEEDFHNNFHYPYDGDIEKFVYQLRHNKTPSHPPINDYNFKFSIRPHNKCQNVEDLRLVFVVKSAPKHFNNRQAIRATWGFERRFSDVEIRRVFLLGVPKSASVQKDIEKESMEFNDIIQANFTDSYYNNTYKTMSGLTWVVNYCGNARFYMFADDDYYVSTKNVLRFIHYPGSYPNYLKTRSLQFDLDMDNDVRLYAGYCFESSPLRHYISKWYVSLDEYPYDKWPPYVTAGAYILSREALHDMYYASFYTKHFRFDDIYMGLLSYKVKIEPFHSQEFYFDKKPYYRKNYEYVVATHGYEDFSELMKVWTDQKSLGYA